MTYRFAANGAMGILFVCVSARVQVIHYLRESNRWLKQQVMQQGESDRQVINHVFKEEKPLRLELNRKRLHQAIELTFDKCCVSTRHALTSCRSTDSDRPHRCCYLTNNFG